MPLLLLDTTVLIDVLRGLQAVERLRRLQEISAAPFVCAISVEELWRGARRGDESAIRELISGLQMAPLGEREGEMAGTWRRDFAAKGITLDQADCLIAAAAVSVGAHLATGNLRDFPMTELVVEEWIAGAR